MNIPKHTTYYLHLFGSSLVAVGLVTFTLMYLFLAWGNKAPVLLKPQDAGPIAFLGLTVTAIGLPFLTWRRKGFDISMGLFLTVALYVILEISVPYLAPTEPSNTSNNPPTQQRIRSEGKIEEQEDSYIGYTYQPNQQRTDTIDIKNDEDEWVTIATHLSETDQYGRRTIPIEGLENRPAHLLFFGGSFTAGYNLPDIHTLPTQVGLLTPSHTPYNYGVDGYGTSSMLAQLESYDLNTQVSQTNGLALYIFINDHIHRTIGHSRVVWREQLPYYYIDRQGLLVNSGTHTTERPLYNLVQGGFMRSPLFTQFNVTIPSRLNENHYILTTEIILKAKQTYQAEWGTDNPFIVVIYPFYGEPELLPYLEEAGIDYLDYDQFPPYTDTDPPDNRYWQSDGHPTALMQQKVAERLAQDLKEKGWLQP